MTTRVEANSYLTDGQHQVYTLREALARNGGTPSGFLELLASVIEDDTWQTVPSGVSNDQPFETFKSFIEAKPPFGLNAKVSDVRILLKLRHPHETNHKVRERMEAMREKVNELLGPDPSVDLAGTDARLFGEYDRSGKWMFGLMVARSVLPGAGKSATERQPSRADGKLSASRFASLAGTSSERVMRYYRAWERAALDGLVPHGDDLVPGQDVELPEPDMWGNYFTTYDPNSERFESIAQQAESEGTSFTEAAKVARHPGAVRTAILGDAKTADAARRALMDRAEDDPDFRAALARQITSTPELKKSLAEEVRKAERLDFIRKIAVEQQMRTRSGQIIAAPGELVAAAEQHLAAIGESDELEAEHTIGAAYGAVTQLVEDTVAADPSLHIEEQKAQLHRILVNTAKGISTVQETSWDEILDDQLIEALTQLRAAVNDLVGKALPPQG